VIKACLAEAVGQRNALRSGRILVVDDDEIFATTSGRILREAGYTVQVAGTFRVALDVLEDCQPLDLMVTDLVMPRQVNGIALSRMARMRRKDLKVMFVTGYDIPGEPDEQMIGPIFRKPISEERFVREVKQLLASQ
jgi:CheY-like chemotaxis protein